MNYFYRRNTPHCHLFLNMFLSDTCKVSTYIYIGTIKIYIIYNYLFHAQLKNIVFLMKRNITSCKKPMLEQYLLLLLVISLCAINYAKISLRSTRKYVFSLLQTERKEANSMYIVCIANETFRISM